MSTHHGYLEEFPWVRVDCFTSVENPYAPPGAARDSATYHFLTHAHSDHLQGLELKSFSAPIYCTPATRDLVLSTMTAHEKAFFAEGIREAPLFKYAHLQPRTTVNRRGVRRRVDLFKTIELGSTIEIESPNGEKVQVTAIDANHCPGSTMYLFQSERANVLVTGDIRVEPVWLDSLRQDISLGTFINAQDKAIDRIYLDTSMAGCDLPCPTKAEAVKEGIELVKMYPAATKFFLNTWTLGYELLLEEVSKAFDTKIHVDFSKSRQYNFDSVKAQLPDLASKLSTNIETRFHACDRYWKCDDVWHGGLGCYVFDRAHEASLRGPKKLKWPHQGGPENESVFVNPVEMPTSAWEEWRADFLERVEKARQGKGQWPSSVLVPLARHSTLPELRDFVSLFRPKSLYPLTMTVSGPFPGHDYMALPTSFEGCLAEGGEKRTLAEAQAFARERTASNRRMLGQQGHDEAFDELDADVNFFDLALSHVTSYLNLQGGGEVENEVEELIKKIKSKIKNRRDDVGPKVAARDEGKGKGKASAASDSTRQVKSTESSDSIIIEDEPGEKPSSSSAKNEDSSKRYLVIDSDDEDETTSKKARS